MDRTRSRIARAFAVTAVGLALALSAASPASARIDATTPTGPCALTKATGETVRGFSKRLIRCAAARWVVPGGAAKAICIAGRESGLVPTARSAGGAYLGLYQHSATYWPSRYRAWTNVGWHLRTTALSGRTNAIVTIRMVHGLGGWASAGWPVRGC
jgi:hypothetical protein